MGSSSISLITNLIIVGILVSMGFLGAKRGFVKSFFAIFGSILSVLFAVLLCTIVADFLESKYSLVTSLSNSVSGVLSGIFGGELMNTPLESTSETTLKETNLATWIIKIILSVKADGSVPPEASISQIISPVFGYYIACIISVIGLFILFKITFFIIAEIVKDMHKIKLVGMLDVTLGAILGIVEAIVFLQVLFMIIKVIPLGLFQTLTIYIENSALANFIDQINLFSIIVKSITENNLIEVILKTIK